MWFTYPLELGFQPNLGGDMCQQLIGWKIMRLKIIEIKIHLIIYILYNKSIIINIVNFKKNFSSFWV
jgi:hypothetical protein